jgi:SAM-dependent MidA family methyltransferase
VVAVRAGATEAVVVAVAAGVAAGVVAAVRYGYDIAYNETKRENIDTPGRSSM